MFVSFIKSLLSRDSVTIFSTSIFLAQKTLSMPHLKTFSRTFSFREDNRLQRSKLACLHSCNLETAAIIAIIIALAIIATFAVTFIVIIGRMAIRCHRILWSVLTLFSRENNTFSLRHGMRYED